MTAQTGACLCGAVRYRVTGVLRPVVFCHCSQCRQTSGHYVAATACRPEDLAIEVDDGLEWYRSSDAAERGFCRRCGGNLFYRPFERRYVSIMAGTLDLPTGLGAEAHVFVAGKSDYYDIVDGLPQHSDRGDVDLAGFAE